MRVTMTALAPIAHGAFDRTGNTVLIRRMTVVGAHGMPKVPCVSANSLRGVLRRIVMRDLFDRAGVSRETLPPKAWDRLYAALANGGHLDSGEAAVDPTKVRALREALPPLSLFGAALYSWMMPGRMRVGFLWPRCSETYEANLVSDPGPGCSAEELVEEIGHARHVDREEQDPSVSGVTPMPTTFEALSAGTVLESSLLLSNTTQVERGALLHGLEALDTIGAKCGAGLGRVDVQVEDGEDVAVVADLSAYREWLAHVEERRASLEALAGDLA